MSRSPCHAARAALLDGRDDGAHVSACAACRAFAADLARVDAALTGQGRAATSSALPSALRARIVAASRAAVPARVAGPAPVRARVLVLDWSLRAAAVAAVLVAGAWVVPQTLFAGESSEPSFELPSLGVGEAFADRVAALPRLAANPGVPDTGDPLPLAGAAAVLFAAAWFVTASRRTA